MRLLSLFLALICFGVSAASALAQTAEERAQLDWAWERGGLIYALDRAGWVATDDIREQMPDFETAGVRGWIVERDGSALVVTFYGGRVEAPVAFYQGRVENGRIASSRIFEADARPPLDLAQKRMVAAREVAGRLDRRPCGNAAFNSVVIPPEAPADPIDVYLLTPQMRDHEWPAGGHYRVTIAADGSVVSSRAFTNTCLDLGGGGDADESFAALMVTHLLDPLPTEIHVFTMWSSRIPLGVATNDPDRVWWVSSEGIRLLHEGE